MSLLEVGSHFAGPQLGDGGMSVEEPSAPAAASGPHRRVRPARRRAGGGGGRARSTSSSAESGPGTAMEPAAAAAAEPAAAIAPSKVSSSTTHTPAAPSPPSRFLLIGFKFAEFVGVLWIWALASAASAAYGSAGRTLGSDATATTTTTTGSSFAVQPVHVIVPCFLLTAVASLDPVERFAETCVGKERLFDAVFKMYSAEPIALALLGLSVNLQSVVGMLAAVLVMFQGTQIFRIHRRTTGTVATGAVDRLLLTSGAMGHHLGTFLFIQNLPFLAFVTAWRTVSISGHSFIFVQKNLNAPKWVLDVMGWSRVVLCLGVFQPILLAALVGRITGSWEAAGWMAKIGSGAVENHAGMIMYLVFRALRMIEVKKLRDAVGLENCNSANKMNTYGRQPFVLETEIVMLLTTSVLLAVIRGFSLGSVADPEMLNVAEFVDFGQQDVLPLLANSTI